MSTTQLSRKAREAEQLAARAWSELTSAVESTGDAARSLSQRTVGLADDAGSWVGSAADVARARALAARDALAGRRPPLPWGLIAAAAVAGAAVGWIAAMARRRQADQLYAASFPEEMTDLPPVKDPSYLSPDAVGEVPAPGSLN